MRNDSLILVKITGLMVPTQSCDLLATIRAKNSPGVTYISNIAYFANN